MIDPDGLPIPTLADVLAARRFIAPYLPPTPFVLAEELSERLGSEAWLKREDTQPIGAFKVRGGVYLVGRLSPDERARGVATASTGNHGQSIAYAGRLFGVRVVVGVPEGSNPVKLAAMRRLGAEVVETGPDFDAARLWIERHAARHGMRYVHSGDEPDLISGVATATLEMIERVPDLDAILVPVGGGSGAAAAALVTKAIDPRIEVIAVQAKGANAVWRAFHHDDWRSSARIETFAEGLATRSAFRYPMRIMRGRLDDLIALDDDDLRAAMALLAESARVLAEGAGAASTAGAVHLRERLRGRKVGLVVSGGNVTIDGLWEALDVARRRTARTS